MRSGDINIASQRLYDLRKSRHWTQDELSVASGLSLRTVQRAEKRGSVSYSTLKSLAAVFDVDAAELEEGLPSTSKNIMSWQWWVLCMAALVILVTLVIVSKYPSANLNALNNEGSLAILPFEFDSTNSQTTQLASMLINELTLQFSKSPWVTIVSVDNSRIDGFSDSSIFQIGDALSVSVIMKGTIYRINEDRFNITVQVIDTKTSTYLWSESYNRNASEVLAIVPSILQSVQSTLYGD